jgi:hypothetical protein
MRVFAAVTAGIGFIPLHRGPAYAAAMYTVFSLGLGISAGPSLEQLRAMGDRIFTQAPVSSSMLVFGSLLLAAVGVSGCVLLWRTNRSAFYFSLGGVAMFLGGAALLNIANPDVPLNPRYVLPMIVPLMVLILAGCGGVLSFSGWRRWLALLYVITVGHSLTNHYFNREYARDDLRSAAAFVRELQPQPQQVVVCAPHLSDVFSYYLQYPLPLLPVGAPDKADAAEPALQELHRKLAGLRRFVLIYSRPDHGDRAGILRKSLTERYRVAQHRHWTGVDAFVLEAPPPDEHEPARRIQHAVVELPAALRQCRRRMQSHRLFPAALLLITAVLWSLGGVLVKSIDWNPMAIAGTRSAIALPVIIACVGWPGWRFSRLQIGGAIAYAGTVIFFVSRRA